MENQLELNKNRMKLRDKLAELLPDVMGVSGNLRPCAKIS